MASSPQRESLPHEASLAIAIVVFHLLINVLHGVTHVHYEIPLELWQHIYIAAVIFVAPIAAAALLVMRRLRAGAWLLLVSMSASALFNIYFHFLLVGPDNVSSVDLHAWGLGFLATAVFLAATELWGVSVTIRLIRAI